MANPNVSVHFGVDRVGPLHYGAECFGSGPLLQHQQDGGWSRLG